VYYRFMLSDEDRTWLTKLSDDLWPEPEEGKRTRRVIVLDATRKLLHEEVERICALIVSAPLLTSMFSKGMFGGFGMDMYEHAEFPGLPPTHLLRIIEDHLPGPKGPSVYEHILGTAKPLPPEPKRHPGCGTDQAWDLFSVYTHSDQNRAWLKENKMQPPKERTHYDY
jgi:hypothetical protein